MQDIVRPRLVLASTSQARCSLLKQVGYSPVVVAPNIDESPLKGETVTSLVKRLAYEKAFQVSKSFENDVILGADTLTIAGRRILGKPADRDEAKKFLQLLSGRRHRVYTGLCVIYQKKVLQRLSCAIVKFKRLSVEELNFYLDSKEWEGKSGACSIRGISSVFVQWINGCDTTIAGLHLYTAYQMLNAVGLKLSCAAQDSSQV
ncbi:septum formation protein Maf [Rickettsiales endosymbiont of Peranema trichophorum]|uniref:Maf family protein n=1 Tax=Rickettsiales endosymbiont of Peranema trichophorum TaxID=2486577 RepID=UPI001023D865|nr:nucleoside triphosphate pyrophosphatase [Rickettsiales endosymbiont of Peranema trichophorum]RZI47538.1 septum formation protein Maf [Rickettsiales endosymbiont of Peranema trichophorum]